MLECAWAETPSLSDGTEKPSLRCGLSGVIDRRLLAKVWPNWGVCAADCTAECRVVRPELSGEGEWRRLSCVGAELRVWSVELWWIRAVVDTSCGGFEDSAGD